MAESFLPGGSASRVVRDGDTVRRDPGDRAEPVHELLRHFGQRGWTGAPRLLGNGAPAAAGAAGSVRAAYHWVLAYRDEIEAALA